MAGRLRRLAVIRRTCFATPSATVPPAGAGVRRWSGLGSRFLAAGAFMVPGSREGSVSARVVGGDSITYRNELERRAISDAFAETPANDALLSRRGSNRSREHGGRQVGSRRTACTHRSSARNRTGSGRVVLSNFADVEEAEPVDPEPLAGINYRGGRRLLDD